MIGIFTFSVAGVEGNGSALESGDWPPVSTRSSIPLVGKVEEKDSPARHEPEYATSAGATPGSAGNMANTMDTTVYRAGKSKRTRKSRTVARGTKLSVPIVRKEVFPPWFIRHGGKLVRETGGLDDV